MQSNFEDRENSGCHSAVMRQGRRKRKKTKTPRGIEEQSNNAVYKVKLVNFHCALVHRIAIGSPTDGCAALRNSPTERNYITGVLLTREMQEKEENHKGRRMTWAASWRTSAVSTEKSFLTSRPHGRKKGGDKFYKMSSELSKRLVLMWDNG